MKNRSTFIILLILITVVLSGCEGPYVDKIEKSIINVNKYNKVYEITEVLDEEQFNEYTKDDGSLFNRFIDFRHQLNNSSKFEFYAFANNFLEIINNEIPETCIVNYGSQFMKDSNYEIDKESITATEAIQVSENFFTLFPLKITAGRSFESSDFDYQNAETIPVILGKNYQEYFNLGDTFEGYYICERKSFTVIGFTDDESYFYLSSNNQMTSYENYIIMPFECIKDDSNSARAILLQQICGFIESHESRTSALHEINECLTEVGLEGWIGSIIVNEKSLQDKID